MGKFITSALTRLVQNRHMNKILAQRIDDYIYDHIVVKANEDLKAMRQKRYEFLSSMLACTLRNIEKGYVSKRIISNIIRVFVDNCLLHNDDEYSKAMRC